MKKHTNRAGGGGTDLDSDLMNPVASTSVQKLAVTQKIANSKTTGKNEGIINIIAKSSKPRVLHRKVP